MSALIFVALAVAWAVYLIPQALKHHEAGDSSRGVERFSDRMRVLARREAVDRRTARLVVPGRPAAVAVSNADVAAVAPSIAASDPTSPDSPSVTPAQVAARRERARLAAARRRRVLLVLLAPLVVVGGLGAAGVLAPVWIAVPAALLAAWLVTCRLMVRRERRPVAPARRAAAPAVDAVAADEEPDDGGPSTEEFDAVLDEVVDDAPAAAATPEPEPTEPAPSAGWDPVAVQLPTYVGKPAAARRTVRTIDLDSTGVWTSGRTAADSALAREADEAARAEREATSAAERARQQRRA